MAGNNPLALRTSALFLLLLMSGCTYTFRPVQYPDSASLAAALSRKYPGITSMKALATVSLRAGDRAASFPEGVIISGSAVRLETLSILYQPLLILVYNRSVSIFDTDTGVCSMYASADRFRQFIYLDIPPATFRNLITGRLPGTPSDMTVVPGGFVLTGETDGASWTASVSGDLNVESVSVIPAGSADPGSGTVCTYEGFSTANGTAIPRYVRCRWEDNRVLVHYDTVHVNVAVDPALMDPDKLCNHE